MDPFEIITESPYWRPSKVSPLYNLEYNDEKFRDYEMLVMQNFVTNFGVRRSNDYDIHFEQLPLLRHSEDDAVTLKITVKQTSRLRGDVNVKIAYTALLISWGIRTCDIHEATHLPFMFEYGSEKVAVAVKYSLKSLFSCNIERYNFTQSEILQLGFKFMEKDQSPDTDLIALFYKDLSCDEHIVGFEFQLGEVRYNWNTVVELCEDESIADDNTYKLLTKSIAHISDINLNLYQLHEIVLPHAKVKSSALRMETPLLIDAVFSVLNAVNIAQM